MGSFISPGQQRKAQQIQSAIQHQKHALIIEFHQSSITLDNVQLLPPTLSEICDLLLSNSCVMEE